MKTFLIQIRSTGYSVKNLINAIEEDSKLNKDIIIISSTGQTVKVKSHLSEQNLFQTIQKDVEEIDITVGEIDS